MADPKCDENDLISTHIDFPESCRPYISGNKELEIFFLDSSPTPTSAPSQEQGIS